MDYSEYSINSKKTIKKITSIGQTFVIASVNVSNII